ncbi:hypothetical protein OPT61_g3894 [Boeremia exigua]|uniref:Uncharacterized protein n=1 Tax=Boeremia exigua TaxID=749465 RepID=A0ACC2IGA1_9PLEO|nr:hypothetical protein OPT61_g3894 [Boeremia exigua]
MASSSISTLQHVTKRKLKQLDGQREKYEANKRRILEQVSTISSARDKVGKLLDGFELHGIVPRQTELSITNLRHFLRQAKHDPSVSSTLLQDWQPRLTHELDVASNKFEYATLFGKLVTEWIHHPNPHTQSKTAQHVQMESETGMKGNLDPSGRRELHEQRAQWEDHAFRETKTDHERITNYLNDIFETALQARKFKSSPLQDLRDSMKRVMDFKSDLDITREGSSGATWASVFESRFTMNSLRTCICGVRKSDLFTGEKREMLEDLENRPAVLKELVDVLNLDLEELDTWEWDGPISLNMRRQLNGKYRVYMDEQIHQAILLHFVGKTWAVALRRAFVTFYRSGAWLQAPDRSMSKVARQRWEHFMGKHVIQASVREYRRQTYEEEYFMTMLPSNMIEDDRAYTAEDQDDMIGGEAPKSPVATKQSMLRLLTTELLLNTKVYGEFLVFQSDFKWFGPSLPHDTIFAVLEFLGIPEKWLRFFKKFLEVPVMFAQDGQNARMRVRKCGIPMSHILSDTLGESVLFCLDFAVNRRTKGANLHRFHDDLWFWGQEHTGIKAWEAIKEFTDVMGLELNDKKTGASLLVADGSGTRAPSPTLPEGKVSWGFLRLDTSSGRWNIDNAQVDEHVAELKRQLGACHSVMAWVQAWNSYADRFFKTNFAEPANCLGRQHNDMIIETFSHIQRSCFADSRAENVTEYLRSVLCERFGMDDTVPDGFFYFPLDLGGLELKNPFIHAFATYKQSFENPGDRVERALEEDHDLYDAAKESWDAGRTQRSESHNLAKQDTPPGTETKDEEPFMTFEEYIMYREETSAPLRAAYSDLLERPLEERVVTNAEMTKALELCGIGNMQASPYWLWVFSLYAGDMKQRFGGQGLQLGERDLLPLGVSCVQKVWCFKAHPTVGPKAAEVSRVKQTPRHVASQARTTLSLQLQSFTSTPLSHSGRSPVMSDPVTYNFYGTTIPVLRSISDSVISTIRQAKDEQSNGSLPTDQEILDSTFGDMLPFRMQPLLLAKFSLAALEFLKLAQADNLTLTPEFKSLDEIIDVFESLKKVYDSVDEKAFNDAAEKSCDISLGPGKPTLHMTGLADYFHGFVIPNSYFHLNAMYMLLRSAGFKLGKRFYVGAFMSQQQQKDWAALRG